MTDNQQLAALLFPDVSETVDDLERRFPPRALPEGARVTRFAPSPTGFLHIGGLFSALISKLNAATTNGRFLLRIEDTDKKREITDGVSEIIKGLSAFGVDIDEGVIGFEQETGDYGPYQQSRRAAIYHVVAKKLVEEGLAYPCFCTEAELTAIREKQEALSLDTKGCYGEWAVYRNKTLAEQQALLAEGRPWTLRLRSPGDPSKRVAYDDLIKGRIEMPENIQDVVLLKQDGIPTYHFAHAVDDHFMRVTHVVRGDEWIASVPLHIQLFKVCGFRLPKYAHIAPIMKEDNGGKRKLSKRKDPEAAVTYYAEQGYPKESVLEYLLTLANSNFEDWRRANPLAPQSAFPFNLKKMSTSGALFDLDKLNDVSKNVISVMDAQTVLDKTLDWAKDYDPQLCNLLSADPDRSRAMFSIDRGGRKPRKDLAKWNEVKAYFSYFFDDLFETSLAELPENITEELAVAVLDAYEAAYDPADDKEQWFERIKALCTPLGCTPNVKEYKQNPDAFKGHVGDLSTVIRVAVTGRRNTPDLFSIMQILGEDRVRARLRKARAAFGC